MKIHFRSGLALISLIVAFLWLSATLIAACSNHNAAAKKVIRAQIKVDQDNAALAAAKLDYLADLEKSRATMKEKLAHNAATIAQFRLRLLQEKQDSAAMQKHRLDLLEERNEALQKSMMAYPDSGQTGWGKFKADFNREADALNHSISNFSGTHLP